MHLIYSLLFVLNENYLLENTNLYILYFSVLCYNLLEYIKILHLSFKVYLIYSLVYLCFIKASFNFLFYCWRKT